MIQIVQRRLESLLALLIGSHVCPVSVFLSFVPGIHIYICLLTPALFNFLFLAETSMHAAVWWLLHTQATTYGPSVIRFFNGCDHCVEEAPRKVNACRTTR